MKTFIRCKRCGKKAYVAYVLHSGEPIYEFLDVCEDCGSDINVGSKKRHFRH